MPACEQVTPRVAFLRYCACNKGCNRLLTVLVAASEKAVLRRRRLQVFSWPTSYVKKQSQGCAASSWYGIWVKKVCGGMSSSWTICKKIFKVCRPTEPYAKKYSRYVVQLNHMQKYVVQLNHMPKTNQGMSSSWTICDNQYFIHFHDLNSIGCFDWHPVRFAWSDFALILIIKKLHLPTYPAMSNLLETVTL